MQPKVRSGLIYWVSWMGPILGNGSVANILPELEFIEKSGNMKTTSRGFMRTVGSEYLESGPAKEADSGEINSDDDLGLKGMFPPDEIERSGLVLDGSDIGLGEEAEFETSVRPYAQLEFDYGSVVKSSEPAQLKHVFGLRDSLSKPKKKGRALLLKRGFLKMGMSTVMAWPYSPVLKSGSINSGDSEPSPPVKQGQEIFLDGISFRGTGIGPLVDEFLMNVVGLGLKEVFQTEFEKLIGQFPSSWPAWNKMAKKSIGRVKVRARV